MTHSYSATYTATFTRSHAVHIAAKVATDLKRMQRFYYEPSDEWIRLFEIEVAVLLKGGYLGTVIYGFRRGGNWIEPTLSYNARDLSGAASDDDPGRVRPGASTSGASFYSYLFYNSAWNQLNQAQRAKFAEQIPFQRDTEPEPGTTGYWSKDLTYSAGNRALDRSTLRSRR